VTQLPLRATRARDYTCPALTYIPTHKMIAQAEDESWVSYQVAF